MDAAQLQALGLTVVPASSSTSGGSGTGGPEAELVFRRAELINPISRRKIDKVRFAIVGGRLVPVAPGELSGLTTLGPANAEILEERLAEAFRDVVAHVQRRAAELQALGLSPQVHPETLQLSTELSFDDQRVTLAADRRGVFSVTAASRGGKPVALPGPTPFELSEFRDRGSLVGYVSSLIGGPSGGTEGSKPSGSQGAQGGAASSLAQAVTLEDLKTHLGAEARVPPQTPIEVLVVMESAGQRYRFAAARVEGRTFRGLLAGPSGKLWSGRFELDQFPGIPALTAKVLSVELGQVRVLARGES